MICRKLYKDKEDGNYNIVFFKSQGVKFPEYLYISVLRTDIPGYNRQVTKLKVDDVFKKAEDYELPTSIIIYGNSSNPEIRMEAYFIRDYEDIFGSAINRICFKGNPTITNFKYNITFYVGKSENDVTFIFGEVSELVFSVENNRTFWYENRLDNSIPFKDFCIAKKTDSNYAEKQEGVAYSLIQRLSVIKGELWYQINHGLPLLDKLRSGEVLDSVIIQIILSHPDVKNITDFQSSITKNHNYQFYAKIMTIYNLEIELSNTY